MAGSESGELEQAAALLAAGVLQGAGQTRTPEREAGARAAAALLALRLLVAGWLDDRVAAAVRWNAGALAGADMARVLLGLLDAVLPAGATAGEIAAPGAILAAYLTPALGLLAHVQQPLRPGVVAARTAAAWGERLLAVTLPGPATAAALGGRATRLWLTARFPGAEGPVERWARLGAARVLDPACGAGAALVEAAAALSEALEGARTAAAAPAAVGGAPAAAHVAAHCLFGIDPRPLAVALARLTLVALSGDPDAGAAHVQAGQPQPGFPWAATFPDVWGEDRAPEQRGFGVILTEQPDALAHLRRPERRLA